MYSTPKYGVISQMQGPSEIDIREYAVGHISRNCSLTFQFTQKTNGRNDFMEIKETTGDQTPKAHEALHGARSLYQK